MRRLRSLLEATDAEFVALAFGLSWVFWLPAALGLVPSAWNPLLHLAGALGPMMAGGLRACATSPAATAGLWSRCMPKTRDWPWLAGVAALPVLVYFAGKQVAQALGAEVTQGFTTRSPEFPALPFLAYALVSIVFYGFGEELGWRGWWLPRLQAHFSPLRSALIQGAVWVPWHAPLFFFLPGYGAMDFWMVLGWAFNTFTAAAIFVWLFNATDGSVAVVALFHAMMNVAFLASPHPAVSLALGGLLTAAALALIVYRPRRGLRLAPSGHAVSGEVLQELPVKA